MRPSSNQRSATSSRPWAGSMTRPPRSTVSTASAAAMRPSTSATDGSGRVGWRRPVGLRSCPGRDRAASRGDRTPGQPTAMATSGGVANTVPGGTSATVGSGRVQGGAKRCESGNPKHGVGLAGSDQARGVEAPGIVLGPAAAEAGARRKAAAPADGLHDARRRCPAPGKRQAGEAGGRVQVVDDAAQHLDRQGIERRRRPHRDAEVRRAQRSASAAMSGDRCCHGRPARVARNRPSITGNCSAPAAECFVIGGRCRSMPGQR